ncbi:MAG: hypothetical protein AAB850_00110 [Patescibacteria group bacterium]
MEKLRSCNIWIGLFQLIGALLLGGGKPMNSMDFAIPALTGAAIGAAVYMISVILKSMTGINHDARRVEVVLVALSLAGLTASSVVLSALSFPAIATGFLVFLTLGLMFIAAVLVQSDCPGEDEPFILLFIGAIPLGIGFLVSTATLLYRKKGLAT